MNQQELNDYFYPTEFLTGEVLYRHKGVVKVLVCPHCKLKVLVTSRQGTMCSHCSKEKNKWINRKMIEEYENTL